MFRVQVYEPPRLYSTNMYSNETLIFGKGEGVRLYCKVGGTHMPEVSISFTSIQGTIQEFTPFSFPIKLTTINMSKFTYNIVHLNGTLKTKFFGQRCFLLCIKNIPMREKKKTGKTNIFLNVLHLIVVRIT